MSTCYEIKLKFVSNYNNFNSMRSTANWKTLSSQPSTTLCRSFRYGIKRSQENKSHSWCLNNSPVSKVSSKVNSSPPSATYTCQWTECVLVQIKACRLNGAKPLSEPLLKYHQLHPKEHISMILYLKFKYFHTRKCDWTCRLRNGSHLVQGEMS